MPFNMTQQSPIDAATDAVRHLLPSPGLPPSELAIVSGSGLGALATLGRELAAADYAEIPGLGGSGVAGHASRWILAEAGGRTFYCLLGRRHIYEGIEPLAAGLAMRVLARLGVRRVILTNAAGGLGPGLRTGDLMLIRDHLNLMLRNPLAGAARPAGNPQDNPEHYVNPYAAGLYDPALCELLAHGALAAGIDLKEGVYAAVCGPSYETRAEVEMLRRMGGHAVGMSTVPEALAAADAGMRVAAISLITNSHWHRGGPACHEEVLEAAARSGRRLRDLLRWMVERPGAEPEI